MVHKTPSEEIFDEIRSAAIKVWSKYDDTHGYHSEKTDIVNRIKNYADDVMVCYRMLDMQNQAEMRDLLSDETLEYIKNNN